MARETFESQKVELTLVGKGEESKQTLGNLKETVTSDDILALGGLFEELGPAETLLGEMVTIKRSSHKKS